jgi:luciferase family oxidoreductase group 1
MKTLAETAFSVLDLAPIRDDGTPADALHNSLSLARHVEALDFTRFWLAEHHNMDGIASAATSVVIGYVASGTTRIRVGSGGVMLPNHPPLVVAENFGTLATLYPGRIDLGLGRAPGADQYTMRALRRDSGSNGEDFPDQVAELQQLLGPRYPGQRLLAMPGSDTNVPIWLLGSSLFSAQLAAREGLPYAFASHFAPRFLHDAIRLYRDNFRPSDAEATFLATTAYQRVLSLMRGESLRMKPPVANMAGLWQPQEQQAVKNFFEMAVVGGPDTVRSRLNAILEKTQADEMIFTCDMYDHAKRLHAFDIAAAARSKISVAA